MVVRLRIGDAEADRNDIEKRRIGQLRPLAAEIVPGVEDELELTGARLLSADQRLVGPAVRVGQDLGDQPAA